MAPDRAPDLEPTAAETEISPPRNLIPLLTGVGTAELLNVVNGIIST